MFHDSTPKTSSTAMISCENATGVDANIHHEWQSPYALDTNKSPINIPIVDYRHTFNISMKKLQIITQSGKESLHRILLVHRTIVKSRENFLNSMASPLTTPVKASWESSMENNACSNQQQSNSQDKNSKFNHQAESWKTAHIPSAAVQEPPSLTITSAFESDLFGDEKDDHREDSDTESDTDTEDDGEGEFSEFAVHQFDRPSTNSSPQSTDHVSLVETIIEVGHHENLAGSELDIQNAETGHNELYHSEDNHTSLQGLHTDSVNDVSIDELNLDDDSINYNSSRNEIVTSLDVDIEMANRQIKNKSNAISPIGSSCSESDALSNVDDISPLTASSGFDDLEANQLDLEDEVNEPTEMKDDISVKNVQSKTYPVKSYSHVVTQTGKEKDSMLTLGSQPKLSSNQSDSSQRTKFLMATPHTAIFKSSHIKSKADFYENDSDCEDENEDDDEEKVHTDSTRKGAPTRMGTANKIIQNIIETVKSNTTAKNAKDVSQEEQESGRKRTRMDDLWNLAASLSQVNRLTSNKPS